MTDLSRRRSSHEKADVPSDPEYAAGFAGLSSVKLSAMIHQSPVGDLSAPTDDAAAPDALAPYLTGTPEMSADAYKEWLTRVCEQPDDD